MLDEGQLISIGDRNLYVAVNGSGPVIVLNSGGGQSGTQHWEPIELELRKFATVITYDRAGLGRSDPPPQLPTARDMSVDLHALLDALQVDRPVVLVGWSLSALLVQLYACNYPEEVAGLVLLDPTPDRFFRGFMNHPPAVREHIRSATIENSKKMAGGDSLLLEVEKMPESSEQVRTAIEDEMRLPNIPVVVLTACKRAHVGQSLGGALVSEHEHIAQRASRGRHVLAERSSHRTMTYDQPDLLVEAIRLVLSEGRGDV